MFDWEDGDEKPQWSPLDISVNNSFVMVIILFEKNNDGG